MTARDINYSIGLEQGLHVAGPYIFPHEDWVRLFGRMRKIIRLVFLIVLKVSATDHPKSLVKPLYGLSLKTVTIF